MCVFQIHIIEQFSKYKAFPNTMQCSALTRTNVDEQFTTRCRPGVGSLLARLQCPHDLHVEEPVTLDHKVQQQNISRFLPRMHHFTHQSLSISPRAPLPPGHRPVAPTKWANSLAGLLLGLCLWSGLTATLCYPLALVLQTVRALLCQKDVGGIA